MVVIILIKWVIWKKCQKKESTKNSPHLPRVLYTYRHNPHRSHRCLEKTRYAEVRINLLFDNIRINSKSTILDETNNNSEKKNLVDPETQL